MSVIEGKWTCPSCHRTVVIYASQADAGCCIKAVQRRHSEAHRAAALVLARLGFPDELRPAKRRTA